MRQGRAVSAARRWRAGTAPRARQGERATSRPWLDRRRHGRRAEPGYHGHRYPKVPPLGHVGSRGQFYVGGHHNSARQKAPQDLIQPAPEQPDGVVKLLPAGRHGANHGPGESGSEGIGGPGWRHRVCDRRAVASSSHPGVPQGGIVCATRAGQAPSGRRLAHHSLGLNSAAWRSPRSARPEIPGDDMPPRSPPSPGRAGGRATVARTGPPTDRPG